MTKIRVRSYGNKIRIRLGDTAQDLSQSGPGQPPAAELAKTIAHDRRVLLLPTRLIDLMEIRVESAFRPNQDDVELVYALTGADHRVPDALHKLSSRTVVEEASEEHIVASAGAMIEHIIREKGSEPMLVVHIHTHPQSIPRPSETDKHFFQGAAVKIADRVPEATVVFGVHAISSESIRERRKTSKISRNTIKWSSITREHEVGFFTPNSEPYEVEIVD